MQYRYMIVCILSLCFASLAQAEEVVWTGASTAQWNDASNWSPHMPTASDDVVMNNGWWNPVVIYSGDDIAINSYLLEGALQANENDWSMIIGQGFEIGKDSSAIFTQAGGSLSVGDALGMGLNTYSSASYYMQGGFLSVGTMILGKEGDAYFENTGGMHTVLTDFRIASEASATRGGDPDYNLDGGDVYVGNMLIVGDRDRGVFTQTNGSVEVVGDLIVGNEARPGSLKGESAYHHSNGNLSAKNLIVGRDDKGWYTKIVAPEGNGQDAFNGDAVLGQFEGSEGEIEISDMSVGFGTPSFITQTQINAGTGTYEGGNLIVGDAGKGTFRQMRGNVEVENRLHIGASSTGEGAYFLEGGTLTVNTNIPDGGPTDSFIGQFGTGYFNQYDGYFDATRSLVYVGDYGTGMYYMRGGLFDANGLVLGENGGNGTMLHFKGDVNVLNEMALGRQVGSKGSYQLAAGAGDTALLETRSETIGVRGSGNFFQSGESSEHRVHEDLAIGSDSSWDYDNEEVVRGYGSYSLQSGLLHVFGNETIGEKADGDFYHYGGTHHVEQDLRIGRLASITVTNEYGSYSHDVNGYGAYYMSGETGLLQVDWNLVVGDTDEGFFSHTAGRVEADHLTVGSDNPGGNGHYMLDGSTNAPVLNTRVEVIGDSGMGIFMQNAGTTHTVSERAFIGGSTLGNGLYEMKGGTFTTDTLQVGFNGNGRMNQYAGTVHAKSTGDAIVIKSGAGTGIYDLIGGTVIAGEEKTVDGVTTFEAGKIINNQIMQFADGNPGATIHVKGNVENNGFMDVWSPATVQFEGMFQNNGRLMTQPGPAYDNRANLEFTDFHIGETGWVESVVNDTFRVSGSYWNESALNTAWRTDKASLVFEGSPSHELKVNAVDFGAVMNGYANNFAWGIAYFNNEDITFTALDESETQWGSLYVGQIGGIIIADGDIVSNFSGNSNVYYMVEKNGWLGGKIYNFSSGTGQLRPVTMTPEPASMILFAVGGAGVAARMIRRRNKK